MKRYFAFIILVVTAFLGTAQERKTLDAANDNTQPQFKFEVEEYNFGAIKGNGGKVSYEFVFTNTGNQPLIITSAKGSCGCTVPEFPKEPILKNQKAKIKVTFDPAGKLGLVTKTVTIVSNAQQNPMTLYIKANVEGAEIANPVTK